ncbi:NAD-dependent succinate-semialdehyde dehydrogenase [uncultured Aeromicrobium sp.]|uniref:NAD-dependent succinate-semialdehyde dehydrogenase n=1 Tax=uncultured Aeromicrobium sp. TaxID=337820 RepID=UPI0025E1A104|nr:NAD-dependent succinate-semialdehyde dehydrogenase [uncultured Aeromicrobium sp.]
MTEHTFEVHDPATGEVVGTVADATVDEAVRAVDAAAAAFPGWARAATRHRAEILRRCFELIVRDAGELAALITAENGKSVADATAEVHYAAEFFRWFSEEAVRTQGSYGPAPAGGATNVVTQVPVGVAALVTPWNFPAAMAARKVAPALAAGCAVVLKPAEETPLTALALGAILQEAGVGEGVVNVVPTTHAASVVSAWLRDSRVRKISFTGSTAVGRALLRQAADRVVNVSMELGGNAPFVVTADADVDAAVAGAVVAKFRGGGQACTAANRFYVHADVAEDFVAGFSAAVTGLTVGPGADRANQVGPVISARARAAIAGLVDDAVAEGARIAVQSTVPETGWFFPPTVLVDVPMGARILSQEIFGPVAPIVTWTDEAAMLESVNDTEYGLAAYVYADRLQDALRLAEQIDAGMVGINRGVVSDPSAPFGGVKQSGIGREGAHEGMREYQETRYYSVEPEPVAGERAETAVSTQ